MTVLNVAYPLHPVSSGSAGGAEQILYLLDSGLKQRGINSLVIAAAGSQVQGELFASQDADGGIDDETRRIAQETHRQIIQRVVADQEVEIVHYHGLDFDTYACCHTNVQLAQIVTVHLPPSWYGDQSFRNRQLHPVCVSHTQAKAIGENVQVIENGIPVDWYNAARETTNRLLWLGRVCPEKGTHLALEAAQRCGLEIDIAGPVHPFASHQAYFEEQVKPLLDRKRRYLGAVELDRKRQLLLSAKALLIPSLAPETSSLVAMEAAAAGLPVVAFNSGALPEVVEHGMTGFIVNSVESMAAGMERISEIKSDICRQRAKIRFGAERMVTEYVQLYRSLLNGSR